MPDRPYLYYELTNSICSECYRKVEAKIVFEDERVYMLKRCPNHGHERVLISTDATFYRKQRDFAKRGQVPLKANTATVYGCPYDCGLCPDHEQHSCLALIEITDHCNLTCPVCYAESSPQRVRYRSLEEIRFMLDRVVENEGEPGIVQISGGEPTLHPELFEILAEARRRPIQHLMLNTNGILLAQDDELVERLAGFLPGFEIYLQFDSLREAPYRDLRGADLLELKLRALDKLNAHGLSTTLVTTLKQGVNDDEIGAIVDFALEQPCVRGVTLQPVQDAGRTEGFDPAVHRLTLGEVRRKLLAQQSVFAEDDVIPVPCHPDCLAMAYALKLGGEVLPLSGAVDPALLLEAEQSSLVFERDLALRERVFDLFSLGHSPESSTGALGRLLCCLPEIDAPDLRYENVFRVLILQFLDPHGFDVRGVKRACVHIVHPDGRVIPFDTYNLFYRDDKERLLAKLTGREAPAEVPSGSG